MIANKASLFIDAALSGTVIMCLVAGVRQIVSDYHRLHAVTNEPLSVAYEAGRCDPEFFALEACLFENASCNSYVAELEDCQRADD